MTLKKGKPSPTPPSVTPTAQRFPPGWDEQRVQRVLAHYEGQTEEEAVAARSADLGQAGGVAVAEDEAAFKDPSQTVMEVPNELVPRVRELIAKHQT